MIIEHKSCMALDIPLRETNSWQKNWLKINPNVKNVKTTAFSKEKYFVLSPISSFK